MLRIINWIIFSLIFCISVILTIPNINQMITVDYWLGKIDTNVAVLLFFALSLGIFLGIVFNLSWVWKLRENNKALKNRYQQVLQQLDIVARSDQDAN